MIRLLVVAVCLVLMFMVMAPFKQVESQTTWGWTDAFTETFPRDVNQAWWIERYVDHADSAWFTRTPVLLGQTIAEQGKILLCVRNKEGSNLSLGDACVWDTTRIVVCDTTAGKTGRIENDLTSEGGWHNLYVVGDGTAADDSLWIYGKDSSGTAQSEILVITDGASSYTKSAYKWTDIDSVKDSQAASGWDSYDVCALPFMGVRASDGVDYAFAGIALGSGWTTTGMSADTIPDNGEGFIVIKGPCLGVIDGNSTNVWPGDQLTTAAAGDLAPAAKQDSAYAGYPRITALEYITAANQSGYVYVK